MSKFYRTDPNDPDAPVVLDEYRGLRPGSPVEYVNPASAIEPLPQPLVITQLVLFPSPDYVSAILNDGEYEVNADNLVALP